MLKIGCPNENIYKSANCKAIRPMAERVNSEICLLTAWREDDNLICLTPFHVKIIPTTRYIYFTGKYLQNIDNVILNYIKNLGPNNTKTALISDHISTSYYLSDC